MSADVPRDVDLETLLDLIIDIALDSARTQMMGRIISFNASRQSCSVQPLVMHAHVDENGNRVVKRLPEMHDIPVFFHGPPTRGRITYPVLKNDLCSIHWSHASTTIQKQTGGLVDPKDDRKHDVSDAIVMVGGHDFAHAMTLVPQDAVVLHSTLPVRIGSAIASDQVMRKSDAERFLELLGDAVDAVSPSDDAMQAFIKFQTAMSAWASGVSSILRTS